MSDLDSPDPPRFVPEAAALPGKKKKNRGVRLSKAEREARRAAREAAAEDEGEELAARRERLALYLGRSEWEQAINTSSGSLVLSRELLSALTSEAAGRPKLLAWSAERVTRALPPSASASAAFAPLVQAELDGARVASALALARGCGLAHLFDFPEHILRGYEAGEAAAREAGEALGGHSAECVELRLATLRQMLAQSRALQYATQYLSALPDLPPPSAEALGAIGSEALALCAGPAPGRAAAAAEAVRAELEPALAAVWPDARLEIFGSAALLLAEEGSDLDLVLLLPSHPLAHCRDAAGRAGVAPLLPLAAAALRGSAHVSGLQTVAAGRAPLLRFQYDAAGGGCVSVELSLNNTDGLANTHVVSALFHARPQLRPVVALARRWAKRRMLSGLHCTLSAYGWTVLASSAMQHLDQLPTVRPSSADFAALLGAPRPPEGAEERGGPAAFYRAADPWALLATASLGPPHSSAASSAASAAELGAASGDAEMISPRAELDSVGQIMAQARVDASTAASAASSSPAPAASAAAADSPHALGLLIWHFFLYYATEFPYRRRVVSLRQPSLSKAEKLAAASRPARWRRKDEQALQVEDPLETSRDLGRLVSRTAVHAMRFEAASALFALTAGGSLEVAVCSPSDWRLCEHAQVLGQQHVARRLEAAGSPGSGSGSGFPSSAPVLVADEAAGDEMMSRLDSLARRAAEPGGAAAAPQLPAQEATQMMVGIDCEGESLSRRGRLCLLQLALPDGTVFLVDTLSAAGPSILRRLSPLLSSKSVLKARLEPCEPPAHPPRAQLREHAPMVGR